MADRRIQFQLKFPIKETLTWEVYKGTIAEALVDEAENVAYQQGVTVDGKKFEDVESESNIEIVGDEYVVTFYDPPAQIPTQRYSFKVTRRMEQDVCFHVDAISEDDAKAQALKIAAETDFSGARGDAFRDTFHVENID